MKLQAGPEARCAGEIISVCAFPTHTHCNNQEHSVWSKQRPAIKLWRWLNIQQGAALIVSWGKNENTTWYSRGSPVCVLMPTCVHALSGVLVENPAPPPSIHIQSWRKPPWWKMLLMTRSPWLHYFWQAMSAKMFLSPSNFNNTHYIWKRSACILDCCKITMYFRTQ